MGVGNGHEPSPNCAGAMFCSQHRCRRPQLLNTDKGKLCQIWLSPAAKQVERHHFYCLHIAFRSAKITVLSEISIFRFFRFRIAWQAIHRQQVIPMASAYLSSLNMDHPDHRCLFTQVISMSSPLHRCRSNLDPRRKDAWHPAAIALELADMATCDGMGAMDVLIGRLCM